jgi:hypothetical protein
MCYAMGIACDLIKEYMWKIRRKTKGKTCYKFVFCDLSQTISSNEYVSIGDRSFCYPGKWLTDSCCFLLAHAQLHSSRRAERMFAYILFSHNAEFRCCLNIKHNVKAAASSVVRCCYQVRESTWNVVDTCSEVKFYLWLCSNAPRCQWPLIVSEQSVASDLLTPHLGTIGGHWPQKEAHLFPELYLYGCKETRRNRIVKSRNFDSKHFLLYI